MFKDRIDAGNQLAQKLLSLKAEDTVVLAIPRGGLPIGAIVAKKLEAPLDVILVKKIGHPSNKEYAIGAVSLNNRILNDQVDIPKSYIAEETERLRALLRKNHDKYYKQHSPIEVRDKTVLIIDDGIATGNTLIATVDLVHRQHPKAMVIAVPVAPLSTILKLKNIPYINEVICLETPSYFEAVGNYYLDFDAVTDDEAIRLLEDQYQ